MNKVILTAAELAKLTAAGGAADVCDETGAVVGVFLTPAEERRMLLGMIPPVTPEERAEALREIEEGRFATTADIQVAVRDAIREIEARK
ncbi:MAG: hypothetical protein ACRC7O_17150 [Fimbriiglobus sp.]